jgi:hypothetical protein
MLVRLIAIGALALAMAPTAAAAQTWTTIRLEMRADPAPERGERGEQGERDERGEREGPGRRPNGESPNYKLLPGEVHWLPGPRVEYRITNAPFRAAEHALARSQRTVDRYITTRAFKRDDDTRQINPCTGQPNTVTWAPIDRPGGLLALTHLCVNTANHEIGGFQTIFDSLDGWSIGPDGDPTTYDVQNVATHEWGHIAGLNHVSRPEDACLTMYFRTGPEEIQQRTLGWGDKRGLDALYHTGDTSPGPGCGR